VFDLIGESGVGRIDWMARIFSMTTTILMSPKLVPNFLLILIAAKFDVHDHQINLAQLPNLADLDL
jgi:hypothetical protein